MAKKEKNKKRKTQIDHEPIVKAFAANLRDLRTARGLKQAELAVKAGVNISYIGRLERATCSPGIDLVARLANALGTSIDELLPSSNADPRPLLKTQIEKRITSVIRNADTPTMSLVAQLLTIIDETTSKRH